MKKYAEKPGTAKALSALFSVSFHWSVCMSRQWSSHVESLLTMHLCLAALPSVDNFMIYHYNERAELTLPALQTTFGNHSNEFSRLCGIDSVRPKHHYAAIHICDQIENTDVSWASSSWNGFTPM